MGVDERPSRPGKAVAAAGVGICAAGGLLGAALGQGRTRPAVSTSVSPSASSYVSSSASVKSVAPVVGVAANPAGKGYWMVSSDGGVFTVAGAGFYGSAGGIHLNQPAVGMAPTPDGHGYWIVASDGGIFSYGDAHFYGSTGGGSTTGVVGMSALPGGGYVLATSGGTADTFTPGAPPPAPPALPTAPAGDPLAGDRFYVVPNSHADQALASDPDPADDAALERIATQPTSIWLGPWDGDTASIQTTVTNYEGDATAKGQVPVFVLYSIPDRDCGGYSSGGYTTDAQYEQFVSAVHAGIAGRQAVVIVEPDALPDISASCLTAAQQADRLMLIHYASTTLSTTGTSVYLDAGQWRTPPDIAGLLVQAGVASDAGFSVDVSNAQSTPAMESYGAQVVSALTADGVAGKHFVIDTSRNGNGFAGNPPGSYCNLPGLALGTPSTSVTEDPIVDAFLWVKYPGDSDGQCTGAGTYDPSAPPAGTFWVPYAVGLANGDSP